ncbi:MAG: thiamine phosphate synthase [bacterium]|nr:thiamine phosphate synthase [bacterium]
MKKYYQVIDANINRVSEGIRVIEEYTRFIAKDKKITGILAETRKAINKMEGNRVNNLKIRNSEKDVRTREVPEKRKNLMQLLTANFKRVEEGLRVLEEYTGDNKFNGYRYDMYQIEKEVILNLKKKNTGTGVYLISDDVEIIKKGLDRGVALVQLRDKKNKKSIILKKAEKIKKITEKYGVPFIVNDYIDIALYVDADGFHSGQDDISITIQRDITGPHKIIGRTTHNLKQGLKAEEEGADYISVGPLWNTPSKPGREGIGFEYLEQVRSKIKIPYVAIGGINLDRIDQVMKYNPPLIGLIRAYESIEQINQYFS